VKSWTQHRAYAPLALLLAVQAVLAIAAPSVRLAGSAESFTAAPTPHAASVAGRDTAGVTAVAPTGDMPTAATASDPSGASVSSIAAGTPPPDAVGDVSHCVGDRQFDPALDWYAPPCTPGGPGEPHPDNGGETSMGVTADEIVMVNYVPDYGPALNSILEAQGLYESYEDGVQLSEAFAGFINSHYTLYGRRLRIETVQGTCSSTPPDMACLIPEINRIVATYHPYAVLWRTTCSPCLAEYARLGVVSFGGVGMSDQFRRDNAPYTWDARISSTLMELAFADWWCSELTSNTRDRRVAFAGTQNPSQDFNGQRRVLGVIAANDRDSEATVRDVLYPALERGCGEKVTHEYFYEANLNTAAQQANAGVAAMNTPENPATTVLCLCVSVAAAVFYNGMQ
jgi:hypothetical protein